MKRILYIFALISAITFCSLPCFASETDTSAESALTQIETTAESGKNEIGAPAGENGSGEIAQTTEENEEVGGENPFSVLYRAFADHAADLFSAVACAASLLIVFSYKKGFLPLAAGALEKLGGKVEGIEKEAEKQSSAAGQLVQKILPELEAAKAALDGFADELEELAVKLPSIEKEAGERALLRTVLSEEIDLLSDVFMASSLPQYKKDEIGERVAAMKALALTGGDAHEGV